MENELITIVMSAYNAEATIKRAVDSILKQTYKNWELIVVDDCSTDGTADAVRNVDDARIRLVCKDYNGGAGLARRTGIECRSDDSKYLCFIDSDDEVFEDYLATLYNAAKKYDCEVVTCGFVGVDGEKQNVEVSNGIHIFNGGLNSRSSAIA